MLQYFQTNEMNMDVAESDDEVVICEIKKELIKIEDTDDDFFGTSSTSLSAPNIAKTGRTRAARKQFVSVNEAKRIPLHKNTVELICKKNTITPYHLFEAKRIPLHKDTIELICKHFGVDFNPEWSLQQFRKVFKERTRMYKKTPELLDAIARRKHHFCRRLFIQFLPNWFEIYHVITLIRLMSKFNVNKPTYFVQVKKKGYNLSGIDPENSMGYMINFLYIEDCRQLLYDMQGLQCFENNIEVFVTVGMLKKLKPQTTIKALNCIKQFRLMQSLWCPDIENEIEIHDSEEDPYQSYRFPLLADLQNNFKESIDPVLEVLQQKENESLAVNENLIDEDKKGFAILKTDEEKVVPYLSEVKMFEEKITPNLKYDQKESCCTVVMDNILNTWGHEEINNLIKSTTGQKMEFIIHMFSDNRDNTVKYLVKFATIKDAFKVCTTLNGIVVCNRRLQVEFETGHDFDANLSTLKRKLDSDWCSENYQPRSKNPRTDFVPTARATTKQAPRFMQNMSARAPNTNRKTMQPQPRPQKNYNHSASQNPYFTHPNPYFAPQNPYLAPQNHCPAPQNSYIAPHNPYLAPQNHCPAPQNSYIAPHNPYLAPQNNCPAPQNSYFAPHNPYLAPQNHCPAPQNSYFAPHNQYVAPQNEYISPQEPYVAPQFRYAPQNQHIQHNWNQSLPQNQNWLRNNYDSNNSMRPDRSRSEVENSKNLKQVQIIPEKENIVMKDEMPTASGSQHTQPHIQIQDIKPVKQEIDIKKEPEIPGIVIKKEPGIPGLVIKNEPGIPEIVIKKEPEEAGYQNNPFQRECNNIKQHLKKERE